MQRVPERGARQLNRAGAVQRENRGLRKEANQFLWRLGLVPIPVAMLRHEREVVQGPQQAAIPGPAERDLRHPRTLVGDVHGGDIDRGKHVAHCVQKHRRQPLRLADRNNDRQSRPLADEQQVLPAAKPEDVAVSVAEPRRGLDSRHVARLFQPDEQLLRAPENDHQLASYSTPPGKADREPDGRRDRPAKRCTSMGADRDTFRAAFVRTI